METFSAIPEYRRSSLAKLASQNLSDDACPFKSTAPTLTSIGNKPTEANAEYIDLSHREVQRLSPLFKQIEEVASPHSIASRKKAIDEARKMLNKKRNQLFLLTITKTLCL